MQQNHQASDEDAYLQGAARLTLGLLDRLQARGPVILVGHSAGALIAMETFKR